MTNNWYPSFNESFELDYFDIREYNHDTIDIEDKTNPTIAKMFFRIDVNQLNYQRSLYGLSDFIGDIGGVHDLLLQVALTVFRRSGLLLTSDS